MISFSRRLFFIMLLYAINSSKGDRINNLLMCFLHANPFFVLHPAFFVLSAACPAGFYVSPHFEAHCIPCAPGSFSNSTTSYPADAGQGCQPCPMSTFSTLPAATFCNSCTAGTFSTVLGSASPDSCFACVAGTYTNTPGSSACKACGLGSSSTDDVDGNRSTYLIFCYDYYYK